MNNQDKGDGGRIATKLFEITEAPLAAGAFNTAGEKGPLQTAVERYAATGETQDLRNVQLLAKFNKAKPPGEKTALDAVLDRIADYPRKDDCEMLRLLGKVQQPKA